MSTIHDGKCRSTCPDSTSITLVLPRPSTSSFWPSVYTAVCSCFISRSIMSFGRDANSGMSKKRFALAVNAVSDSSFCRAANVARFTLHSVHFSTHVTVAERKYPNSSDSSPKMAPLSSVHTSMAAAPAPTTTFRRPHSTT